MVPSIHNHCRPSCLTKIQPGTTECAQVMLLTVKTHPGSIGLLNKSEAELRYNLAVVSIRDMYPNVNHRTGRRRSGSPTAKGQEPSVHVESLAGLLSIRHSDAALLAVHEVQPHISVGNKAI